MQAHLGTINIVLKKHDKELIAVTGRRLLAMYLAKQPLSLSLTRSQANRRVSKAK
jgi:hypothetical protein